MNVLFYLNYHFVYDFRHYKYPTMPGERRHIVNHQRHPQPGPKISPASNKGVKRTGTTSSQRVQRNYSITSHKEKDNVRGTTTHRGHGHNKQQEVKKEEVVVVDHVEQNGSSNTEQEEEAMKVEVNTEQTKEETNLEMEIEPEAKETPQQEEQKNQKDETWAEKAPAGYNIMSFNDTILEYSDVFESDKFNTVNEDFPVDELISFVNVISGTIEKFKQQSQDSQKQLESLCSKMRQVKENIHYSITKKQIELTPGKF